MNIGKNFIVVLILTLITVIGWVSFEVYRSFNTSTIPSTAQELISPLNPNFDQDLVKKLKANANEN
ncbi:MAG: hypothetical protein M1150_02970 [Patescibacteria group bacterium]|nr:hypothetical protein [Patescibacteria group bacterium]